MTDAVIKIEHEKETSTYLVYIEGDVEYGDDVSTDFENAFTYDDPTDPNPHAAELLLYPDAAGARRAAGAFASILHRKFGIDIAVQWI